MNIPRRGFVTLPLVLFAAAIAGCTRSEPAPGSGPETSATPAGPADDAAATKRTVAVAAASDLKYALDDVIATFARQHPEIAVQATYGSSGNFFAQLSNRAPFDLYLSADRDYPRRLIEEGLAEKDSEFVYAIGHIVVWVRNESALDLETLGIQALLDESVRKIAIANPQHAPYGRAAEAALKHLGVYEDVQDRLVLGENISQAAQFVESGAADIGVIALSLATSPAMKDKGRSWPVPAEAHPPLEQAGVILSWAKDRDAAEALRSFLLGEEGRQVLESYGFALPEK